ncbi:MAG: IS5 family transposase, partial [Pseudomonadota bacterium]
IETVLLLAAAFDLPLRQAEGFARSILAFMDLDLPVPDHTTLARRRHTVCLDMHAPGRTAPVDLVLDSTGLKFFGPGEWARAKRGEKRHDWRMLHIGVDAATGEILSHFLTNSDTSDAAMAGPSVETAGGRIRTVIAPSRRLQAIACRAADGANYGALATDAIRNARPAGAPPRIVRRENDPPDRFSDPAHSRRRGPRFRHLERPTAARSVSATSLEIAAHRRIACPSRTGYGKRALAEAAISRLTSRGGATLRARTFGAQCQEIGSRIAAANKAIRSVKPITVRVP